VSDHDTSELADDLPELDHRARGAAAALRHRIDTLVPEDHGDPSVTAAHTDGISPTDLAAPATDPVGEMRSLDRAGGRRRRWWLAAAAVTVVAAAGGAVAVVTGDDHPDVTSGGQPDYLLPGWLPEGLEPTSAIDFANAATSGGLGGLSGEIAGYGDPDSDDPWASTLAVTHFVIPPEMADEWQMTEGEPVTLAGHEATLSEIDGSDSGSPGPGWQVQWPVEDGQMAVAGTRLSREEVLAAAAEATPDPAIGPGSLPDGFTELARGPLDAAAPGLGIVTPSTGLAVTYTIPSEGDDGRSVVSIIERSGPESAVDLLRGSYADSDAITVRGRHAVVGRGDGQVVVQWAEPEGQLITVLGYGVAEDAVLRVADQLRPAGAGEVAALLADHAPPAAGEFDDPPEGHVEVASGGTPNGRWRVVVDTTAPEGMEALSVERVSESGDSSSGTASWMGGDGSAAPPPLEVSTDTEDGVTIVYGLVHPDAAAVTIEAPGLSGVSLGFHDVEGWQRRPFAGQLTEEQIAGVGGGEAVVIARAADGRELGRTQISVGPDPLLPGDQPSGDVAEACTTLPDGTTECSVSSGSGATATIPADR
jgi:hypothetical protein